MRHTLVLVPVDAAMAGELAAGRSLPGPLAGFMANAALAQTFGLAEPGDDQAEYAALQVAQVAGLARYGCRLVLTAQVDEAAVLGPDEAEAHNGGVLLPGLAPRAVEAFFAPDAPDASQLAAGVAGLEVDDAWASPGVTGLLADAPLAWHDVTELPQWLGVM